MSGKEKGIWDFGRLTCKLINRVVNICMELGLRGLTKRKNRGTEKAHPKIRYIMM
jgi:hypothetical protein